MKLKITENKFDPQSHTNYKSYLESILERNDLEEAIVRFSPRVARFVTDQKYFQGFVESKKIDGWEQMKFMTASQMALAHWLIQFTDQIEIVEPPQLKEIILELLDKAQQHHIS